MNSQNVEEKEEELEGSVEEEGGEQEAERTDARGTKGIIRGSYEITFINMSYRYKDRIYY